MKTIVAFLLTCQLLSCQTSEKASSELAGGSQNKTFSGRLSPKITRGKYKGRTVDTTRWRPVVQINDSKRLGKLVAHLGAGRDDYHLFENVKVDQSYHIAAIPKNPADIEFMVIRFEAPVPAAHTILWYQFKKAKPVILFDPKTLKPTGKVLEDLLQSSDAGRPKGEKYHVFKGGATGDFVLVHGFYDMVNIMRRDLDKVDKMESIRLKLDSEARARILKEGLELSHRDGYNVTYNTLSEANCHGAALKAMDLGLKNNYSFKDRLLSKSSFVANIYPVRAKAAVRRRGIYLDDYKLMQNPRVKVIVDQLRSGAL